MAFDLDPEVAVGLNQLAAKIAAAGPAAPGLETARERAALNMGSDQPLPVEVQRRDVQLTSFDRAQVAARWYWTTDASPTAAAIYLHGGGMVVGSIDISDWLVCEYVLRSGVPMLAVDYRLAPEHPFPIPQEDGYAALCWLADHAEELGVDQDRIAVMGDSAGGGLAASVALMARDRNGPKISQQLLIYPMIDDRLEPDQQLVNGPYLQLLTEPNLALGYQPVLAGWNALLEGRAGSADVPAMAAPARLQDARGLPPAYIDVGDIDIFRAENVAYATKLLSHGVPVELHVHPGCPHGYDIFARDAVVTHRALAERVRVLQQL
jgi:acetyl esterase/lipase